MAKIHSLGFPRIGQGRELKFQLESYWAGNSSLEALEATGVQLRQTHWNLQKNLDVLPVGDFSFYDHVLDMSFLLGHIPTRAQRNGEAGLDTYFRVARGRSANDSECSCVRAGEMTKWFDTNYHYIVPEVSIETTFKLQPERLIHQVREAKRLGHQVKPVIIGPLTYLSLCKGDSGFNPLDFISDIVPVYELLLATLAKEGVEWVQVDEPLLVTELQEGWKQAYEHAYQSLKGAGIKILLATYFGQLKENLQLACKLPVAGLHLDAIRAREEVSQVADWLSGIQVLSLGVIDGRNIWKTNLNATLDWLQPIADSFGDRLWLAPSCSLLHVPMNLELETVLDSEVQQWLAFAVQKISELEILQQAINVGRDAVQDILFENQQACLARRASLRVTNPKVTTAVEKISAKFAERKSPFASRVRQQQFDLPLLPTTTIGSFPQTTEIRQARSAFKRGEIQRDSYELQMRRHIQDTVARQEEIGLDVLVHGEAERNDMVEFFGEQLEGFVFSNFGWVQSYGSRCVKPPILFGDVSRPKPMTLYWTEYAQSLTTKKMKGMLTGPVTILNWSFVRDDIPRLESAQQIALAIREEVLDLERAGISIIQIDEAALREGLPLRRSQWQEYLSWAVGAFRVSANGVADSTQIHTHMCYSEFNDIIEAIAQMDADVITIETSRSNMELLDVFDEFEYPNQIGPGVYDIHSPNIPSQRQIESLLVSAAAKIPVERLWVNPDCGLKTRQWSEVTPALTQMVKAATELRQQVVALATETPKKLELT